MYITKNAKTASILPVSEKWAAKPFKTFHSCTRVPIKGRCYIHHEHSSSLHKFTKSPAKTNNKINIKYGWKRERIALSKHKIKTFDENWTCATFKNVQHLKRSIQLIEIDIKPSIYFE